MDPLTMFKDGARHTDMRTTMKYVHAADSRLEKMVNRAEVVPIVRQLSDVKNKICNISKLYRKGFFRIPPSPPYYF